MAAAELVRQGWHLTDEGINGLGNKGATDSIVKKALDNDLKEIGATWLSDDINRGRLDYVEGPSVLQLSKLRIVSAPKDNEDSQAAPKIYRLSLTDGHVTCSAVTLEPIKGLGLNTPPGSKLLLSGTVEVETTFLLLTNKNTVLLGGRVSHLADSWELKKSLAKQSLARANVRGEGGPPPFVPFGNKISSDLLPPPRKDNFKSLESNKEKKTSEGDAEFQQQRQAALNEALQAKGSSRGGKTFGGGKVLVNDRDVARITEMGFSANEAATALKASSGDVNEAINSLLSGGQRFHRGGDRGKPAGRGGGFDGRGEGRRRGRDRDFDNDVDDPVNTRPSGPATLFDFLETKIPAKNDHKKPYKSLDTKMASLPSASSISNDSSFKFIKDHNDKPQRRPPTQASESPYSGPPYSGPPQSQPNYKDGSVGYQDSYKRGRGESSFNNRGPPQQQQQQNVPPRFAKLGRGDGQRIGGGQGRNDGGGGYRGGGERYNGSRDGGYDNRHDTFSDKNRTSFKEDSYGDEGRGSSGVHKDGKYRGYQGDEPQNETGQNYNDDHKHVSVSQGGDASRSNLGNQGSRTDEGSGNKPQNYGNNQYRNSSRSDGKDGMSQPYKGQPSNRTYNQQPPLMPTPYPSQQPSQEPQFTPVPAKQGYSERQLTVSGSFPLNINDTCLAKYWEDNEFYPAVVEALAPNGSTVLVRFIEYGNQEEVFVGDIQPLQQHRWAYPASVYGVPAMNASLQDPSAFQGAPTYVPPMEFTRGGSYYNSSYNGGGRRQDNGNDRRRPTQSHYMPPNQRLH